jgi:hypothetical protein
MHGGDPRWRGKPSTGDGGSSMNSGAASRQALLHGTMTGEGNEEGPVDSLIYLVNEG